ncbi:MAG TPA: hypothetical protein DDY37_05120 [Legionella sp.]|nr:hypothetical protein [Legionella sp.]
MKYKKLILSIFLLSLLPITQAKEASQVRHVILNNTMDSIRYDFQNTTGSPCHESGKILPGQFKDLNCQDAKSTSYSVYSLNLTIFYTGWFGSVTNRCTSIKEYDVKNDKLLNDKQLIWTVNDLCLVDVTEI